MTSRTIHSYSRDKKLFNSSPVIVETKQNTTPKKQYKTYFIRRRLHLYNNLAQLYPEEHYKDIMDTLAINDTRLSKQFTTIENFFQEESKRKKVTLDYFKDWLRNIYGISLSLKPKDEKEDTEGILRSFEKNIIRMRSSIRNNCSPQNAGIGGVENSIIEQIDWDRKRCA